MNTDIKNILDNLGISELSQMQKDAFEQSSDKDLILLSPTGSGKTIAYFLQIVKSISPQDSCLVIVPSRELAIQTYEQFKKAKTGLGISCCYGGRPAGSEKRMLEENKNIIIGTPGRICDHLANGNINPANITLWTVDEFDKALEMGFKEQIETIYNSLKNIRKKIFISATYSDYFKQYVKIGKDADVIDYRNNDSQPNIKQYVVHSSETDKADTLIRLLHDIGSRQSIVFVNYRESVERLSTILKEHGIYHVTYHGGMEQMDREKSLSRFKSKSVYTMLTTDLASRGLDIEGVDAIIHYHLPVSQEAFLHRNGRSARWHAEGRVFTIVNEKDRLQDWMPEMEEYEIKNPDQPIPRPVFTTIYIGKGKLDKISKGDILGYLCKKAGLNGEDIGTIIIKEKFSFAAVKTSKVKQALNNAAGEKLKGKKVIIEIANS